MLEVVHWLLTLLDLVAGLWPFKLNDTVVDCRAGFVWNKINCFFWHPSTLWGSRRPHFPPARGPCPPFNRCLKFLCLLKRSHAWFCALKDLVSLVFKQKLLAFTGLFWFQVLGFDRTLSQRDGDCSTDVPVQRQWPWGRRCPKMEFAALRSWRFCLGACVHCCSLQGQASERSLHKPPHVILLE